MKRTILFFTIIGLIGVRGEAGEIKGKWGLGVRVVPISYSSTISVLRGISSRTALLGLISFSIHHRDINSYWYSTISTGIGGEWRRYTRPENRISPYFGMGPSFGLTRSRSSSFNRLEWNAGLGFNFGAEYHVNEYLSLSSHLPLLGYTFTNGKIEYSNGDEDREKLHDFHFLINPSLIFRLYF